MLYFVRNLSIAVLLMYRYLWPLVNSISLSEENARPGDDRQAHCEQLHTHTESLKRKGTFVVVSDSDSRLHGKLYGEADVPGPYMCAKDCQGIGHALQTTGF